MLEELQGETARYQRITPTLLCSELIWVIKEPLESCIDVPQGAVAVDEALYSFAGSTQSEKTLLVEKLQQGLPHRCIARMVQEL